MELCCSDWIYQHDMPQEFLHGMGLYPRRTQQSPSYSYTGYSINTEHKAE
jgi:hypothetical protein